MNSYLVVVCFQLGYSLCMLVMVLTNNTVLHLKMKNIIYQCSNAQKSLIYKQVFVVICVRPKTK